MGEILLIIDETKDLFYNADNLTKEDADALIKLLEVVKQEVLAQIFDDVVSQNNSLNNLLVNITEKIEDLKTKGLTAASRRTISELELLRNQIKSKDFKSMVAQLSSYKENRKKLLGSCYDSLITDTGEVVSYGGKNIVSIDDYYGRYNVDEKLVEQLCQILGDKKVASQLRTYVTLYLRNKQISKEKTDDERRLELYSIFIGDLDSLSEMFEINNRINSGKKSLNLVSNRIGELKNTKTRTIPNLIFPYLGFKTKQGEIDSLRKKLEEISGDISKHDSLLAEKINKFLENLRAADKGMVEDTIKLSLSDVDDKELKENGIKGSLAKDLRTLRGVNGKRFIKSNYEILLNHTSHLSRMESNSKIDFEEYSETLDDRIKELPIEECIKLYEIDSMPPKNGMTPFISLNILRIIQLYKNITMDDKSFGDLTGLSKEEIEATYEGIVESYILQKRMEYKNITNE